MIEVGLGGSGGGSVDNKEWDDDDVVSVVFLKPSEPVSGKKNNWRMADISDSLGLYVRTPRNWW